MKISLEWLAEYLPGPLDAQTAADALTNGGLPVEQIETVVGDTVIDVEVTSNRGDCLSHVGVARELAALLNRPYRDVQPAAVEANQAVGAVTSVRIDSPELCPHYTARVLRNVKIKPSPAWMVRRLEAIGLRSINNVVDVTNYVMFEMGQPLHAFDYDKLNGGRIVVRNAQPGETLTSIDGHERKLTTDMLVIADANRAVALAGVMGGRDSEVSDSTVNVLLESARFDPLSIRKTARALAMKSDSSYRFERRIDPTLPERASLRAAQLILETAGGELLAGMAAAGASGYEAKKLSLRMARLKQILGIEIPTSDVMDALARLQLSPVLVGDHVDVTVPSYRLDLNVEVDLVEEVARVFGYDKVPVRDEIAIRLNAPEPWKQTVDQVRTILVAGGYFEAVTFSWVSDLLATDFLPPQAKSLPRADVSVRKADANLRPSILPGLLEAVRRNENAGTFGAKFFEIGSTFWYDGTGKMDERRRLGMVGSSDLRDVRGVIDALLNKLDRNKTLRVIPDSHPGYAKDACGRLEWDGEVIGYLGKIDSAIAEKLALRDVPAAAEIEVAPLLAGARHVQQLNPLPRFPAVRRDLSLIVNEPIRFEQIDTLVRNLRLDWLEELEYVTSYRGKPLAKGQKSVTVTLVFRSPTETLTSEQFEASVQKVIEAAKEQLQATLRS